MRKKLLVCGVFVISAPVGLLLLIATIIAFPSISEGTQTAQAQMPFFTQLFRAFQKEKPTVNSTAMHSDARVILIEKFYDRYNSPLQDHAEFIVETADKYHIDYRLIPAISMQESTGCKFIPENSYNCWGYGIYGNKVTRFSNFQEAIDTVSRGLRRNYYDKGLTTPQTIMAKYTPPALEKGGSWAKGVYFFFEVIENPNLEESDTIPIVTPQSIMHPTTDKNAPQLKVHPVKDNE